MLVSNKLLKNIEPMKKNEINS